MIRDGEEYYLNMKVALKKNNYLIDLLGDLKELSLTQSRCPSQWRQRSAKRLGMMMILKKGIWEKKWDIN